MASRPIGSRGPASLRNPIEGLRRKVQKRESPRLGAGDEDEFFAESEFVSPHAGSVNALSGDACERPEKIRPGTAIRRN
jgi:hypothetical protein